MRTWFFFNSNNGEQMEIEESQLSRFLRQISESAIPYTFVWMNGWKHWVPLVKVPEFMSLREATPPPPPPMGTRYPAQGSARTSSSEDKKLRVVKEVTKTRREVTGTDGIQRFYQPSKPAVSVSNTSASKSASKSHTKSFLSKSGGRERRAVSRVEIRLKVMVKMGEQVFRSFTANASVRGILLEDPIPSTMMESEVELFIYSPDLKSCLRVIAHLVKDQKVPRHLKFSSETDDLTERRLLSWITSLTTEDPKVASRK